MHHPCCDCCLVKGQEHTLPCPICHPASANALRAELDRMREARDNARAEVERLTALVAEVRATAEHYARDRPRLPSGKLSSQAPPTVGRSFAV